MEEQQADIDNLLSDAGDYVETRATLWKLKAIESLSEVSGELVSGMGLIFISSFVIVIFTIGLCLLLGEWTGKAYYGFFIVGGLWTIFGLLLYARRARWLKEPFSNMLIRKILK